MKFWSVVFLIFSFDFATKMLAKSFLQTHDIAIWNPYISLHLAFNEGIAFSFPLPYAAQIVLTVGFIIGFLWWWHRCFDELSSFEKWGSVLVFAGALGNFWERVVFSQVTDFILLQFPPYSFPVFNIADIAISLGVLLWIIGIWNEQKKKT